MLKKTLTISLGMMMLWTGMFGDVQFAAAATKKQTSITAATLIEATNKAREGKHALTLNTALQRAAQGKADDMVKRGYFAHTTPYGKTPWAWIQEAGYAYESAGENLAVNFDSAEEVVDGWLNSPSHKANLLNDAYTEVGIGIAVGEYEGTKNAVYVVEFYGQPKKTVLATIYGLFFN